MEDVLPTKYPLHKNLHPQSANSDFLTLKNWWTAGEQHTTPFTHSVFIPPFSHTGGSASILKYSQLERAAGDRELQSSMDRINLSSCSFHHGKMGSKEQLPPTTGQSRLLTLHPTGTSPAYFCFSWGCRMVEMGRGEGLSSRKTSPSKRGWHPERVERGSAHSGNAGTGGTSTKGQRRKADLNSALLC